MYETDESCTQTNLISTDGSIQVHTFHKEGDEDWIRFEAQANKSYQLKIQNDGVRANAVIFVYTDCVSSPAESGQNAFGSTVTLDWDAATNGPVYVQLQQFDGTIFGTDTHYQISVLKDTFEPLPPENLRCESINDSTISAQWERSTRFEDFDVVGYVFNWGPGNQTIKGANTTYYEVSGLTTGQDYVMKVRAVDFSDNRSVWSDPVTCAPQPPQDSTQPSASIQSPGASGVYTVSNVSTVIAGVATDSGGNLSRVHVRNTTNNLEKWDYTLTGASANFRVTDLGLSPGENQIQVTVYDEVGNTSQSATTINRVVGKGAVIIVAGHNETFGLQTNISFATNRAYRIFLNAGFSDDDIFYVSPTAQDPDGDGTSDEVDRSPGTPSDIQYAIESWATEDGRLGPDKPLFLYFMDHGLEEKFCVSGCGAGKHVTPVELDSWLRTMEDATGVSEVNIVMEACRSGSFIDRLAATDSITKLGRVVITSAGASTNAYASAQGAYFSDAFFSCIVDSNDLKNCFDEATQAVLIAGTQQTPWLDDNGDGIYNSGDGSVAQTRKLSRFFSSFRPEITAVNVQTQGVDGILSATVTEGAEPIGVVWAAVYPPSFQEPDGVTINLQVPVVRLEKDPANPEQFTVTYPNGFTEAGEYRIVFYAQDVTGINAQPVRPGGNQSKLFLPAVKR